ncbi:hypothetical protein Ahy_A05g025319 [Arachis hypogaea]|uniref:Transposase Tnp1/En/Spm-like domain-containing protein n=1 Tax=Arachis hypogaea TaxID=3818 RepID=A0A445D897_ARAHY|nr:hypothetical protein Ahy_A05g025319 [Arachis hypogaea]
MPRKSRYRSIPDVDTADKTQNIVTQTSGKNTSFRPPLTQKDAGNATAQLTEIENVAEHAQIFSEDEDYDPETDEVESWDDFVDNLYAEEEVVSRNKPYKSKDTDYWSVVVSDGGVTRTMNLSVRKAIVLPPGRQIILEFNTEMQAIGSLGADFQHFPINEDSWKTMDKALKEHANDTIKRTFLYEEDDRGKRKKVMIQRLGKIWKEARNHLYHKCYDEQMSWEENLKKKPSGINIQQWRWFVNYRLKESTKKKCRQNALNRSKQLYTHTRSSKTTVRLRDEEEKKQQRRIGRGEMFIMTHKKRDGSYMNDDARVVGEAIANIESQDGSSKEISLTDLLAQVFGKEHSGRVQGLGFGPCTTEIIRNTTQQSNSGVQIEEYQREITELKAAAAEQKAEIIELKAAAAKHKAETAEELEKRQTMMNLIKYMLQQQGDTLPLEIDAQLKSLENGAQ